MTYSAGFTERQPPMYSLFESAIAGNLDSIDIPDVTVPSISVPEVSTPSSSPSTAVSLDADPVAALAELDALTPRTTDRVDGVPEYDSTEHRFPWDNYGRSCWTVREQNIIDHAQGNGESFTVSDDACVIESAVVYDPWTGSFVEYDRLRDGNVFPMDTEHIVAWAELWRGGAGLLTVDQQRDIYNDFDNLVPVDPSVNRSVHSDNMWGESGWGTGQYPVAESKCWAASQMVHVYSKWGLHPHVDEVAALRSTLTGCAA